MKVAFIIQRYGTEIVGGAEFYVRAVAEKLCKYHDIEILTTCAKDYRTWRNDYKDGVEKVNGVIVRRFKNSKERDIKLHQRFEGKVFRDAHSKKDEIKWLEGQGPYCKDLIRYIDKNKDNYDCFIFFTFRYYPSYYGINLVGNKSLLVPFAENDPALNLEITEDTFRDVKGIVYSTPEEKELINKRVVSSGDKALWELIGLGVEVPSDVEDSEEVDDYILYLGRVDGSKGCHKLFEYYLKAEKELQDIPELLLAGYSAIDIPKNKKIKYMGFIPEDEKFSLLKSAKFLIMPSPYESLSIVTLEALASGTPVLVNGECDVLKGHCIRSNAGLWYQNYDEFVECIRYLSSDGNLRRKMGINGKRYIELNYSWNRVEKKYLDTLKSFAQSQVS